LRMLLGLSGPAAESASHFEGLPTSVLEAMAAGVAVVASGVGDVPSLLEGEAGIVLQAPITVAALQEAIQRLIDDDALRGEIGKRGRQRAAAFDWRLTVRRYEELLSGVAARRPRGRAA